MCCILYVAVIAVVAVAVVGIGETRCNCIRKRALDFLSLF